MVSDWTITETSSALSIKLRTGQITLEQRAAALSAFNTLIAENLTVLMVSGAPFRAVAKFANQHTLCLRAGDVLHPAIASEHGAAVCTLDQKLAEAGHAIGVPTLNVER